MSLPPRIELLAPAGDERALRAALAAGADAVYFGLERWSARAFAGNFAGEAAVRAIELAHRFDAHAYLALNTLFRDDEIGPALKALEAPYRAGLDGLIVADLGFAALVRDLYPDLPLHASTQLNTHSSAQLDALGRLGFARAILARELSLAEIAALDAHGLELEAFVHGALCYGYSGDCLLASMVGGRSGNRGRCSQSCRLRYRLSRADGPPGSPMPGAGGRMEERGTPRGGASRVLSTADLCAIAALPDLIAAGVTSFKVEGRMKDPAYVAVTTAVYREALDTAVADPDGYAVRPEWMARLEQSFSRGFTTAHLDGRHHEVRSGGRGGHRGVLVGRVERVQDESGAVVVRLAKPVAAGDVVYLYTSQGQTEPVRLDDGAGESLTLCVRERVSVKDRLFRLAAAGVDEFARDAVAGRYLARPIGLSMRLEGGEGDPATLTVRLARAARDLPGSRGGSPPDVAAVGLSTPGALVVARTAALTEAKARDALGALGGTPYGLEELQFAVADGLFLSVAELKDLRRRAVATLDERRLAARRRDLPGARPHAAGAQASDAGPARLAGGPARPARRDDAAHGAVGPEDAAGAEVAADRRSVTGGVGPGPSVPRLAVPVVMLLDVDDEPRPVPGVVELCLDLETTAPVRDVAATFARCAASGLPVRCRPPEVLFDGDLAWWREVAELPWDAVVVRHLGLLAELAPSAPLRPGVSAPGAERPRRRRAGRPRRPLPGGGRRLTRSVARGGRGARRPAPIPRSTSGARDPRLRSSAGAAHA